MSTAKGSRSKIAPRREVNTRRGAIVIDSSSEDLTTKTRTKTVSVATTSKGRDDRSATTSISSLNADLPPPSSGTDLTTEPTMIRRSDTLPLQPAMINDDDSGETILQNDETFILQRTPPRSALNTLPYVPGTVSSTRTMSLPVQSPGSADENFNGLVSPHRATSAMAKRSGNKGNKSPRKLATDSTPKPSASTKTPSKRLRKIVEDEDDQALISSNPIESTSSMPELARPRSPIIFLRDLMHNDSSSQHPRSITKTRATQKGPQKEPQAQVGSTEDETQSSTASQEQRFYARYGAAQKEVYRPVTQPAAIHNPPGVFVSSQTQSDHHMVDETQDASQRHSVPLKRAVTTLVAGTPSTVSESSQPERELDFTQIYTTGRALFHHESPGTELIPTQSLVPTQGYVPTQVVNGSGEEMHPTQPIVATEEADLEPETQSVVGTIEISPRKPGKYYASSSESSSIPGLNMTQDASISPTERRSQSSDRRMAAPPVPSLKKSSAASMTQQQTAPGVAFTSGTRPTAPFAEYRNPSRGPDTASGSRQIKTPANTGPAPSKMPAPALPPLKRNPLTRRKSPAAVDLAIFAKMGAKDKDTSVVQANPAKAAAAETQLIETVFEPSRGGTVTTKETDTNGSIQVPDPVMAQNKGNPLTRRKSPVAFEQFMLERKRMTTYREKEVTITAEDDERAGTEEIETQSPPLPSDTFSKDDTGFEKPEETVLSEVGDSEVMETDEEARFQLSWPTALTQVIGRTPFTESPEEVVSSPEEDRTIVAHKQEEVGFSRRDAHFQDSTLQRKSAHTETTQRSSTGKDVQNPQPRITRKRKAVAVEELSDDEDSSSEDDNDNASDYQPQATQTQLDFLEGEAVNTDDESQFVSKPPKPTASSRRGIGKRRPQNRGGRDLKRLCQRDITPKLSPALVSPKMSTKKKTVDMEIPASKPVLPPLDTSTAPVDPSLNMISRTRTSRRSTRGQSFSKAVAAAEAGHLVFVRHPDKRWYPGYTLTKVRKSWEIRPCDERSATVVVELKYIRIGELRVDDAVFVAARPAGEDWGDALVIGVDERWEKFREVKVKIGTGEETYVGVQYISIYDRDIGLTWDDRKVTHEDLEAVDGLERVQLKTTTSLARTASIIPTPTNGTSARPATSYRSFPTSSRKIFNGIGFILTSCGLEDTKLIKDRGGHIYESWLNIFQFGGSIETAKGGHERWIHRANGESGRRRSSMSVDVSPIKFIGNDNEESVKSIFVVAGKVMITAKILIALSFGIPCVSTKWLEACGASGERVDWIPYLLPSHTVPSPLSLQSDGYGLPAQSPDYQWSSEVYNNQYILENILSHPPLLHHRILAGKPSVLCIAPDCLSQLREDVEEMAPCQSPFVYCCLAMGAQHVEAVDQYSHATDPKLTKYDLIIIADSIAEMIDGHDPSTNALTILLKKATRSEKMVINQSDIKMSIACGKLIKSSNFDLN